MHTLSDDERATWDLLVALSRELPAALDDHLLRNCGMSHHEFEVLTALSEAADHCLPMSALAAQTGSQPSRLSHTLVRLEKQGWAARRPADTDRRVTIACLTPEGQQTVERAVPLYVAQVHRLVKGYVPPEQQPVIRQATEGIRERLALELSTTPRRQRDSSTRQLDGAR